MRALALAAIVSTVLLTGCGTLIDAVLDEAGEPDKIAMIDSAIPRAEPKSKTGNNPYTVFGKTYLPMDSAAGYKERGIASWYGKKFHGRRTSSGERYNMYKMTAAHKTLPLPTYVQVTNLNNGRQVIVKVNDRGPFIGDRIIDLSYAAATHLDMAESGIGPVEVVALTVNSASPQSDPSVYFLQVGSFRLWNNAKAMESDLKNARIGPTKIESVVIDGVGYHQVRVGPVNSGEEIKRKVSDLESKLQIKPLIVTN